MSGKLPFDLPEIPGQAVGFLPRLVVLATLVLPVAVLAADLASEGGVTSLFPAPSANTPGPESSPALSAADPDPAASTPSPFFDYEVLAREGDEILSLSRYPSINDKGFVAFTATTAAPGPRGAIFLADEAGRLVRLSGDHDVWGAGGGAEINDDNQVVIFSSRSVADGGGLALLGSDLALWNEGAPGCDPAVPGCALEMKAASVWSIDDLENRTTPEAFELIGPWPSLNNRGQVAFVAADGSTSVFGGSARDPGDIVAERLVLATPIGATFREPFHALSLGESLPLDQTDAIAPDIADDGRVVLRRGFAATAPIEIFDYDMSRSEVIAGPAQGFTSLGSGPAVSDDGKAVAFVGDRGDGPGLFLAVDDGTGYETTNLLVSVVGEEVSQCRPELGYARAWTGTDEAGSTFVELPPICFQSLAFDRRLGVTHVERGAPGWADDSVVIAFVGQPTQSSRMNPMAPGTPILFSAEEGLWTVRVDFERFPDPAGLVAHPRSALPVAQVGDILQGARIDAVHVYDPVALATRDRDGLDRASQARGDHRVVFSAETSAGSIIARASHLDTDEDGLLDHWETRGIDMDGDGGIDLDLPTLGANPAHKDVFLEIDWLAPRTEGSPQPWRNQLQPGVTDRLVQMFADAPVNNPDGAPGIVLHVDAGPGKDPVMGRPLSRNLPEGSALQGGDEVHPPGLPGRHIDVVYRTGSTAPAGLVALPFSELKDLFFGTRDKRARELAFHYALSADFSRFLEGPDGQPFLGKVVRVGTDTAGRPYLDAAPEPANLENRTAILTSGASAGELREVVSQSGSRLVFSASDGPAADPRWAPAPGDTFAVVGLNGGIGEEGILGNDFALPGNDFILCPGGLSNGLRGSWFDQWTTLAHELGHNLGLKHCGVSAPSEDCDDIRTGVTVINTGRPPVVSEGGLTLTLSLALNSRPSAPVDIDLFGRHGQIQAVPSRITFSRSDWNARKTFQVRAVDDAFLDDLSPDSALFGGQLGSWHDDALELTVTSEDPHFHGIATGRARIEVYDDERPGLIALVRKPTQVVEAGPGTSYQVLLTSPPRAGVAVALSAPSPVEATPSMLAFSPADWNVPQTVVLTAPANGLRDRFQTLVRHTASSADPSYNGSQLDVPFNFKDREGDPAVIVVESGATTEVSEGGSGDSILVSLVRPPPGSAKVRFSADSGEIRFAPAEIEFTASDWNTPKPIAVEAVDDSRVAEGLHADDLEIVVEEGSVSSIEVLRVRVWDNDFDLEPDHRSLMSYGHQEETTAVNDYAGPGVPLFDEWSHLKGDFSSVFSHVGEFPAEFSPELGISLRRYIELFGHRPDVEGPEVRVLTPGSGLEVPLSSGLHVRVLARDESGRMRGVSFLADVDGDGAISASERIEATEVGVDVYEANITGLSGPAGGRGVRVLAEDLAGNYTLQDLDVDVVPDEANRPPVAADGFTSTAQGTPVAVSLSASDPNGAPLSFAVVSPPTNGALTGLPPRLVYEPNPGFSGHDAFTFRASDGLAESNLATWTIMVGDVNEPPVLTAPPAVVVDEGRTIRLDISAVDRDGDTLSLAAAGLPAFASFADEGGGHGSLTLAPSAADVGSHAVEITASDDRFTSRAIVAVTVQPFNESPVLAPIENLSCFEGFTCTTFVTASDPDGDPLAFSAAGLPAFATFTDLGDGQARLMLAPLSLSDSGEYPEVTVSVTDGELTASETFLISVAGDTGPPRIRQVLPPDGATFLRGLLAVTVQFEEPLEAASVSTANFRLAANGSPVTPLAVESRFYGSQVVLTFEPLPPAVYELTIDAASVTDRSGNPLGDAPLVASRFTLVDRASSSSSLFPGRVYDTSASPNLASGDLDEDGHVDVVTAGAVTMAHFGSGDGTFAEGLGLLGFSYNVALGDLNGDGHLDLVTLEGGSRLVTSRLGNGDGTFGGPIQAGALSSQLVSLALGDMDGDGVLDVVTTASAYNLYVLKGAGDGSLTPITSRSNANEPLALGDVNGDGHLDVVTMNRNIAQIAVYFGSATGSLPGSPTVYDLPAAPRAISLGDVDEDGDLDVVVAASRNVPSLQGSAHVLRNNGDGTFAAAIALEVPAATDYRSLAIADLDADRHLDLVLGASTLNQVVEKLGSGDGSFAASGSYGSIQVPGRLVFEDFDGDGDLDLAAKSSASSARNFGVLFGEGDGTFPVHPDYPLDQLGARSIDLGDVDGDGDLDAAVAYLGATAGAQGFVSILLGNDDGSFGAPATYAAGIRSTFVRLRDLDRNGALDMVVANSESGGLSVFPGVGDGTFGPATAYGAGAFPAGFDLGDVDGNGTLDVVAAAAGGGLTVRPGNGDGTFGAFATTLFSSTNFSSVALGDVDGDGDLDIAAKYLSFPLVAVCLGGGDGTFGPATALAAGNRDGDILFADLDLDDDLDIVTGSRNATLGDGQNFVSVLLGNGDGSFAAHVDYRVGERPGSIAIGRVDDDAYLDVVSAHPEQDTVAILLGVGDGTLAGRTTYDVGYLPQSVALGDLDRDGRLDFVTANERSPDPSALLPGTISPRLQGGEDGGSAGLPDADAGPDRTVEAGSVVMLDGSASASPLPGDVPALEWLQTAGPGVFLAGARSATPSFVPSEVGIYAFQLTVTAGGRSATDMVAITAVGSPDLVLTAEDGRIVVLPGQTFTRTLTVTNVGNAPASGIRLIDELPPFTTFLDASDGGSASGSVASWAPFGLAPLESVTRTLAVSVATTFPAGVETLTHTASVVDDGSHGSEPTPENNVSVDGNELRAAPDLAVQIDDGRARALPGETLTYVLTVQNLGSQEAAGVSLRATPPPASTLGAASDGGTLADGSAAWPAFSIAAGSRTVRTFTVRLDEAWPSGLARIEASATVADDGANGPDVRVDDNAAVDGDLVLLPDLSVSKDDAVDTATPGQTTTYEIRIRNRGQEGATGIVVTDIPPPGTSLESASDGGLLSGEQVVWPPFDLAPSATALRRVTLRVDEGLATTVASLTNTVVVRDDGTHGPDPTPEDATAVDTDRVSRPTDLAVAQGVSADPAAVGEDLSYVLEVTNLGPEEATAVTVRDLLPAGVTQVSTTTSRGVCAGAGLVVCSLGDLAPAATATVRLVVRPSQAGGITNLVTVHSLTADSDNGNNRSVATSEVSEAVPAWTFTNEAEHAGLATPGAKAGGLGWCDFNHDGLPDAVVNAGDEGSDGRSHLYRNRGDRTFTDVTATHAAGLGRRRAHRSLVCGDLNGDGYVDLARNEQGLVEVYLNRGPAAAPPFSFGDERQDPNQALTAIAGGMSTEGMGLLDFDRDGDLDVVVDNDAFGIDLLVNDGTGWLTHATPDDDSRGLPTTASSGDFLAVADYDVDGWVDVLDRKRGEPDLWRNRGDGTFESPGFDQEADEANKGGVAFCDFDADGDFDLVWTDAGINQVWRNRGGVFEPTAEPSSSSGVDLSAVDLDGVACADVDSDGDLDLFFGASQGPSHLFLNRTPAGPDATLDFVPDNRGIDVQADAEGLAFADFDLDGDLDLLVNVDGASNQLWESHQNDAGDDRYLVVRALACLGAGRYRDDIGATVRLFASDGVTPLGPVQEVSGGSGHGSQGPPWIHFGLLSGAAEEHVVEVRFTNGQVVRHSVVPAEAGPYQLLPVKGCAEEDQPPVALDLAVVVEVPVEIELLATDPEGRTLTYEIVEGPATGTLTGSGRVLEYVPDPDFAGDSFTYRAHDGRLESNVARVALEAPILPFGESADEVGLATPGDKKGGLAWCDFNGDGALDLLVNAEHRSHLYLDQGGRFADVTATHAAGLSREVSPLSAICGDLNNDGHLDFARNAPGRVEIYLNQGPDAGPPWSFGKPPGQRPHQVIDKMLGGMNTGGMGFLDFDHDGDLDLVVDNHEFGIDLFANNHNGHFQHITKNKRTTGLPQEAAGGDYLAVADFDADGWVDLIARKRGQFDLWRNLGGETFGVVPSLDAEASAENEGGVAFCDFDADGDLDVFWTDADTSQIWRNYQGIFFPTGEPSLSSGVDLAEENLDGVACADVDNDGDLDVFVAGGAGPSHLFLNETAPGSDSPLAFVRQNLSIYVGADGGAAGFADYDRDGDQDLLVNVDGGDNQLWTNATGGEDFLMVRALRCLGKGRHRDDIGATIRLFEEDGTTPVGPLQEVNGGSGYGSQNPAYVHFGLPRGPRRTYVVAVGFVGGPTVRASVRPADQGRGHLLVVRNCDE